MRKTKMESMRGREICGQMNAEKISPREAALWLTGAWLAKLCVLLPFVLAGQEPGRAVLSIVTGIVFWGLAMAVVRCRLNPGRPYFEDLRERCGHWAALAVGFAGFWYFLAFTAVFARLWAELWRACLPIPIRPAVLCVLPLAAGALEAHGNLKKHTAARQAAGAVLLALTLLLAGLAAKAVPAGGYRLEAADGAAQTGMYAAAQDPLSLAAAGFEVSACIGGLFLPLFSENILDRRRACRAAGFAACICAVTAGGFCAAAWLRFGGVRADWPDFPAVEAVRTLHPFGVDVGRLHAALALLLLAGLAATVAGGIRQLRAVCRFLYSEAVLAHRMWLAGRLPDMPDVGLAGRYRRTPQRPASAAGRAGAAEFSEELSGLTYVQRFRCRKNRLPDPLTSKRVGWQIVLLAAYALAVGFEGALSAMAFYRAYLVQIMTPVVLLLCFALIFLQKRIVDAETDVLYSHNDGEQHITEKVESRV